MTEETIFATALDKQKPAERSAFLEEVCAGDAALRQRVESLIAAHEQAADFLERPAVEQIEAGVSPLRSHAEAILAATEGITGTPANAHFGPTQAERSPGGGDELSLDFLSPSEKPGALGRIDHYHVLGVIGRGGFGVVLKAFDEELQRIVAIKVMAPQLASTGTARRRFRREAQAAAAVRDEHVIDIHAVEEVNGLPYLVMEYVSGISLQDRLDQSGPLELREILRIGMQTATGLAKAHAQGLIHRDIKPANILLENGVQRVKITDFGLARAVDDASLTQSGVIAGTPQYMAPEQARGEAVDHRADLFSLGSLLYAMCTGYPPFRASSTMAVLKRVCDGTPRPIREINSDIPDWLCAIIEKLQAKEPADRFQSATEVAELLGQHLSHLQQPSLVPKPPEVVVPKSGPSRERSNAAAWVLVAVILGFCMLPVAGLLVSFYMAIFPEMGPATDSQIDDIGAPPLVGGWELEKGDAPRQIRQSRTILLGNPCRTPAVAFSPDKKTLATGDDRGWIFLWDARSGNKIPMFQFQAHSTTIWSLAFSHDGKQLASGCWDGTAKIWDVATHQLRANLPRRKDRIWCVAFSADSKLLALASGEHGVLLWDVDRKEMRGSLDIATCPLSVAFSPKDGLLAVGDSLGGVRLWNVVSGQPRDGFEGHAGQVRLAFSTDGKTLATAGHDKTVILWDVATRQKLSQLAEFQQMIESIAFSSDGRLLATGGGNWRDPGASGEVTLWDVVKHKKLAHFVGHAGCVHTVAFSPDGKTLASASHDQTVRIWDVPSSTPTVRSLSGHTLMVWGMAWTPDGQMLASASLDKTVRIWRREGDGWQMGQVLEAHPGGARSVAFSRNGRILATGGHDSTVKLWHWDGMRWHQGRTLRGHKDSVHAVAFAPDGSLASGGGSWPQKARGEVKIWNVRTGEELASLAGHEVHVNALTFSPDGKWLATASADLTVKLWDTATWRPIATLEHKEAIGINSVSFAPDSNLLAAGAGDHTITLWKHDGNRWQEHKRLLGHTDAVWPVAFHPDGKLLASGAADKTVKLWDVETGKELASLPGHTGQVRGLAFSPDGNTIATGADDKMVKLWDVSRWASPLKDPRK
jgi:WD40 repeat protein/serine/threonine protein kinase